MNNTLRFVRPIKLLGQSYSYAKKCVEQNIAINASVDKFKVTRKVSVFLKELIALKLSCDVQQAKITQLYNDNVRIIMHKNKKEMTDCLARHKLPVSI